MVGGDEIIEALSVVAFGAFTFGTVYLFARSCFNWRHAFNLFGFLAITSFIWRFLEYSSRPSESVFQTHCAKISESVFECGGWLFTTETVYDLAKEAQSWMVSTELAQGQAAIAGFVVVAIALSEYSRAVFAGGLKALVGAALVVVFTYLIFNNITDIQRSINHAFDMTLSLGKHDPKVSYDKLAKMFDQFKDLEMKFQLYSVLSFKKSIVNNFAGLAGGLFKMMFGLISWVNLVMFLYQSLMIIYVPSLTATAFLHFKIKGASAAMKPLALVVSAVAGRAFVCAQMMCINKINISPDFGTLAGTDFWDMMDFAITYAAAMFALMIGIVTMLVYIGRLLWSHIFSSRVEGLI